jgi:hypothetical protein
MMSRDFKYEKIHISGIVISWINKENIRTTIFGIGTLFTLEIEPGDIIVLSKNNVIKYFYIHTVLSNTKLEACYLPKLDITTFNHMCEPEIYHKCESIFNVVNFFAYKKIPL